MSRVALAIHNLTGLQPSELMPIAKLAEQRGFEAVLMTEATNDALAFVEAFAFSTERIGLGTAIVNMYQRHPIQLVAQCSAIDDVSKKRLNYLGIGTGHRFANESFFGIRMEQPLQVMREYVEVVRLAQTGEPIQYHGKVFTIEQFQPRLAPVRHRLPIYLAALSKRLLHLVGELADGVYLYLLPDAHFAWTVEQIRDGARAAGRDPASIDLACLYMTLVHPDPERARAFARQQLARFCANPFYNRHVANAGFADEAAGIREAAARGDREVAIAAVTEAMVDQLVVAGTADECRQKIEQKRALGMGLPAVFPYPVDQSWDACLREATEIFGNPS
ncbi:MAG: LLM class flavin-dependent oxidoreductase [Chloroflexi bacterium]|nr:LLM class flavin-dependent oxidoreductase [Chloroflexota bacterium]